jgi:hypothetical protein
MARLTNRDRQVLRTILADAERAQRYLDRPDLAVAYKGGAATTTLHYTRAIDGAVLYELDKAHGSDLIGLPLAIRALAEFLTHH